MRTPRTFFIGVHQAAARVSLPTLQWILQFLVRFACVWTT